jgi:hypothetical protein
MPPKWIITDANGTVIAEGEVTPIASGGGAAQGQNTDEKEPPKDEPDGENVV